MNSKTLFYVLKRLGLALLTVWIVISITFFVMHAVPGGPFMAEKAISAEAQAALEAKYGLDKPLMQQYGTYLTANAKYGFWGLVILVAWQQIGYMMIIYIAGLQAVPEDMLEAARIDGATRWQVVWNINIPTILPTVIIMLILRVGGILGVGFEKVFLLQTNLNMSVSRVISTYTYERTLGAGGTTAYWDYSAAIGLFNTFINLALIMITNTISRKVGETSLF